MAEKEPTKPIDPESESEPSVDDSSSSEPSLDETIRIDIVQMQDDSHTPIPHQQDAEVELESTIELDSSQLTVVEDQADQTIQIDSTGSSNGEHITVHRGTGSAQKNVDPLAAKSPEESTVKIDTDSNQPSVDGDFSIMTSSEIGQTVNPRELSDQDANEWNSAVGQPRPGSDARPVIEESYVQQRLKRLRHVEVAELKSSPEMSFDYRLVRKLGQGGMGDVFVARQGSLDRLLAIKLIKPLSGEKRDQLEKTGRLNDVEQERRQQFLSEAIVTGDLDHPNIVPIHDVGLTSNNELFYAMKRVVGTPWSAVIGEKSRDENLEILLKAADAIGFAHTRGVVHRDIKPENIMLGDFGVVMVMDWGLALLTSEYEKQESIATTSGLGGTPAFMAPEMATGPVDKIGRESDIYLLGATLFMIITGKPPHFARNISECLLAVHGNVIREFPPQMQGELMDIALKAMATNPTNRYAKVEDFQNAIREYRSHAESIAMATRAMDDLALGKENRSYADLSRATFRFEESLKSWQGNVKAKQGLAEAKILHATAAYDNGDFDLGLSLLDDSNPEHLPILQKLSAGLAERQSHAARLLLLRKVAVAMLAFILIGGSVALFAINQQKRIAQTAHDDERIARQSADQARVDAERAREDAENAKKTAEEQQFLAEINEQEAREQEREAAKQKAEAERQAAIAEQQRSDALQAKQVAESERANALLARQQAVYEEYVSKIGLAKARLERNEVDGAKQILQQLLDSSPETARTWEWRWLWRQANQAVSSQRTGAAVTDFSISASGRGGVVAHGNGSISRFEIDSQGKISSTQPVAIDLPNGARATSVAVGPDEAPIAVGTNTGQIILVHQGAAATLHGHTEQVSDLQFTADGLLISGSHDKTVRVWDAATGRQLTSSQACWHISPVQQIAVSHAGAAITLAVAIADDSDGQIELWKLRRSGSTVSVKQAGTFDRHTNRVTSVAITPDGKRIASGDSGGDVLLWDALDVSSTDFAISLRDAIESIDGNSATAKAAEESVAQVKRLIDSSPAPQSRLVSMTPPENHRQRAHDDAIRSICFNAAGSSVLTGSNDNTLKLWNTGDRQLHKTLKGHGGPVVGANFLFGQDDVVISASNDTTVRSWNPKNYVGSFVSTPIAADSVAQSTTAAHQDEIGSACFSPDGTHLVTASRDHTARVMRIDPDTLAFSEVARLQDELLQEGSEFVAMSMQLDQKHQRLYVGSADQTIRVWDLSRGVQIGRARNTGLNTAFAVSADGTLMLTGSSSPKVKAVLWRLDATGHSQPRVIHRVVGHHQSVTALAIAADSKQFFTADRDGRGILWDVKTGQRVGPPIDILRGFRINTAMFLNEGNELLIGADDQQLTRIDLKTRSIVSRMNHDGVVTQISLAADGRRVLTVSEWVTGDGLSTAATLWDLATQSKTLLEQTADPKRDSGRRITSASFDPDGNVAAVAHAWTAKEPAIVRIWDVRAINPNVGQRHLVSRLTSASENTKGSRKSFRLPSVLGTAQAAIPIDDHSMLTINKNGVFLWNTHNQKLVTSYRPHAALTEASFSFDGLRVATASRSVKIWDPTSGKSLGKIESPHAGPVRTIQFAPKGFGETKYVFATGGDDRFVRIWSWNDDNHQIKPLREYEIDADDVVIRRLRFSSDAEQLLVVGDRGVARLLDLRQSRDPVVLDVSDAGDHTCCSISADGTVVAIGSTDSCVRLWNLPGPEGKLIEPVILSGHGDVVNDVKLIGKSLHGMRVLTASADDTARLWDPRLDGNVAVRRAGRELLSLRRHTSDVMAIDATPDGELVMTADREGTVILWPAGK